VDSTRLDFRREAFFLLIGVTAVLLAPVSISQSSDSSGWDCNSFDTFLDFVGFTEALLTFAGAFLDIVALALDTEDLVGAFNVLVGITLTFCLVMDGLGFLETSLLGGCFDTEFFFECCFLVLVTALDSFWEIRAMLCDTINTTNKAFYMYICHFIHIKSIFTVINIYPFIY